MNDVINNVPRELLELIMDDYEIDRQTIRIQIRALLAKPNHSEQPYPLPDDLYTGSKDWRESNYAGRVEWLHTMYESAKREVERLEDGAKPADGCENAEVPCSEHPDAPHGFNRSASHTIDRYVCDCEGWEAPKAGDV